MAKNWSLHVRFGEIGEAWMMMMIMPWEGEGKKDENINVFETKGWVVDVVVLAERESKGKEEGLFQDSVTSRNENQKMNVLYSI